MVTFKPDNYLTACTRFHNNEEIVPMLRFKASQSDICLSFDIKYDIAGWPRKDQPEVVVTGSDFNGYQLILQWETNKWFHAEVNLSSADLFFQLYVSEPNFIVGLDNLSLNCSEMSKYPVLFFIMCKAITYCLDQPLKQFLVLYLIVFDCKIGLNRK